MLFFHNFSTFTGRPGLYLEVFILCPTIALKESSYSLLRYTLTVVTSHAQYVHSFYRRLPSLHFHLSASAWSVRVNVRPRIALSVMMQHLYHFYAPHTIPLSPLPHFAVSFLSPPPQYVSITLRESACTRMDADADTHTRACTLMAPANTHMTRIQAYKCSTLYALGPLCSAKFQEKRSCFSSL